MKNERGAGWIIHLQYFGGGFRRGMRRLADYFGIKRQLVVMDANTTKIKS